MTRKNACVLAALVSLVGGNFVFQSLAKEKDKPSDKQNQKTVELETPRATDGARYKNLELFQKVLHFVETNFVDEVDNTKLVHGAIKGMLATLDPHSNFLPPEIFKDMKVDTSGKFGGVGIEVGLRDGVLTIVTPIEGTPAWKAGLLAGDRIVKIDDASTKGMSLSEAVVKMRGGKGSKIKISFFRTGFDKVKELTLTREEIKIRAVAEKMVLEPNFGYVRLQTFNENAANDLKSALAGFEQKGKLKGLVLDLRTNPGGLLDQAVDVTSIFIDEGVIVSTIGRDRAQKEIKYARRGETRKDLAVAVLVGSSTASAAEIVAGALQDHKRAVVLGAPTFGKGSVQTVIDLGDQMGLKLTIARYYTPSGRSIQEKGVMPDILLDQYDPELLKKAKISRDSLREKDLPGHIIGEEKGDDKDEDVGGKEFSAEELEKLSDAENSSRKSEPTDLKPVDMNPREDYQVRQALNYLKSYDIFQKISSR